MSEQKKVAKMDPKKNGHVVVAIGAERLVRVEAYKTKLAQKVGVNLKRTAVVHSLLDKALDLVEAGK